MSLFLSGDRGIARSLSSCLLAVAIGGCFSAPERIDPPGFEDDFGASFDTQPITLESIGESSMVRQRAQFDLRLGGAVPIESNMEPGFAIDAKFNYEVFQNLFMGLNFGYSHHDIDKGADDSLTSDLAALDADQLYEDFDRYSILGQFDYDVPLTRPTSDLGAMTLRFGLGVGLLIINGEEDPFLKDQAALAGETFEIVTYYTAVVRPGVEFRWRVWEHGHVFAGVSYDWVPDDHIDVKINNDRREVSDSINFDAVNLGAGFSLEW